MTTETLLSWHYLIFWLPMMASAFLILLSSLRLGHHHGVRHGHTGHSGGHMRIASHGGGQGRIHHAGGGRTHGAGPARSAGGRGARDGDGNQSALTHVHQQQLTHGPVDVHTHTPAAVILGLIGAERAPLPIVLQSFFLFWGFFGLSANLALIHSTAPAILQVLPSLGIALVGGGLGARGAAEVAARVLPPDESAIVSRDGLYGLTGEVTFAVTETGGRIFVYDDYGTLHDESCRVATGQPSIEKGRRAIVLDKDEKGNLIVKEIA